MSNTRGGYLMKKLTKRNIKRFDTIEAYVVPSCQGACASVACAYVAAKQDAQIQRRSQYLSNK